MLRYIITLVRYKRVRGKLVERTKQVVVDAYCQQIAEISAKIAHPRHRITLVRPL